MPYDPRMMSGPPAPAQQQYDPYAGTALPWWQQLQQRQQQRQQQMQQFGQPGQSANSPNPSQQGMQLMPYVSGPGQEQGQMQPMPYVSGRGQPQPGLLEMGLNIGRMTRPQYNKAVQGTGPAAMVSPWAWLGSMGGGR